MHPETDPSVTRPGKSVSRWLDEASQRNRAFNRLSEPLASVLAPSRPITQETIHKWEESLKESTMVCNQAARFNRCVNKIQDEVLNNL